MGADGMNKTLRYRHVIFGVLGLGYIVVFFHRLCPAVLAVDMMENLHAGGTLIGILGSAYFYPYALMQLPAGLLSDSWGARKSVAVFLSIAFIGSVLLGLAPSVIWAIAGRALVGLGVSMLFVPTMKVLSEWYNAGEFAVMSGFLMAIGGIGSLASAGPLAWMSAHIGWRMSFISVGIITLVVVVLVALLVRDRPADLGWPSPVEHAGASPQVIGLWEGVGKVLSNFSFWPLAVWFFFNTVIFFALGGLWGGPYLIQTYHVTKATAGNILSMISIGMIVGSPGLSFLSNRIFKARKPLLVTASVMLALIAVVMSIFTADAPKSLLYLLFLGIGLFSGAVVAVGFTTAKELFPVQIAGTSIGLINLFPFIGGALFQPFIGYVLEQSGRMNGAFTVSGYRRAMLVFLCCSLLAFFSSLFIKETVKKPLHGYPTKDS
jgi:sugar phosphate permease